MVAASGLCLLKLDDARFELSGMTRLGHLSNENVCIAENGGLALALCLAR